MISQNEKSANKTEKNKRNSKDNVFFSFFKGLGKNRIRLCALFLAIVLGGVAVAFSMSKNVAYAADPVLWGHKGKDKITTVTEGEIARFDDGTDETDPAEYSDNSWGFFLLGGINRVSKDSLLTTRPKKTTATGTQVGIDGVNAVDTYSEYISRNVSVVRYRGGNDSNLGISVNGESKGYIKMNVSGASGRYLYYSISVESLTGASGSNYGTFAVNTGNSSGLVVRTEKNKNGGAAFLSGNNAYASYADSSNWVSGYEYGCIDLKALTGNDGGQISEVYLFGTSKTKVILNYLIASNDAPTKIDVANGNIVCADDTWGDDTPAGATRTYSNKNGYQGTAKMTLTNTKWFSFENLVVDTNYTPYLYYSFTVNSDNNTSLYYTVDNSRRVVAGGKLKSVTGCVKLSTLLGKSGIINITSNDNIGRGLTFDGKANLTVNYLFFGSGLDVSSGDHVIVKNSESYDVRNANGSFKNNFKVENFSGGSLPASYTYKEKTNSDSSKGVWALYDVEIAPSNIAVDFCWYVNKTDTLSGAQKIGSANVAGNDTVVVTLSAGNTVTINASVSVENTDENGKKAILKVYNPTKKHNGLYFFCLVVARNNSGSFLFRETLDSVAMNSLSNYWNLTGGFCRLDVADNVVYHGVRRDGSEGGIIAEDWIVYGTDCKVTAEFQNLGGYLRYNKYVAPTATQAPGFSNSGTAVCEGGYKIRNYSYSDMDSSVADIIFNGWMHFDETIKNPYGAQSHSNYLNVYKSYYNLNSIQYVNDVDHKSWTLPAEWSLTLNGDTTSILHDTTINLYTKWEIPVSAHKLEIEVFVDQFGTTFMAQKIDGENLLYNMGNKGQTTSGGINYSIQDGTVTVNANRDDGFGYVTGRVYLEKGKIYTFTCETDGTWGKETGTDTVEAFLMLNGGYEYYKSMSSKNFTFTVDNTGTYYLRLDVNKAGETQKFWDIKISNDLKMVYSPKDGDGKNEFIEDTIYAAVAPITSSSSNGRLQYFVNGGTEWVDLDDNASALKGKFTVMNSMSTVEKWYRDHTEYSYDNMIYAVRMKTDDILEAFGKGNYDSELKITFRYIAGIADDNNWFNFTGKAVCGSFEFIPFRYNDLT